jgi:hypothetical protein
VTFSRLILFCSVAATACGRGASSSTPPSADASGEGRSDGGPKDGAESVDGTARDARAESDARAFTPTTSTSELVQNNTAGCGSASSPCSKPWVQTHSVQYDSGSYSGMTRTIDGFWDHLVSPGMQAPSSRYGYVSKVPMSVLLPDHAVPVWVETQNWWGGGSGHIDNGESSANSAQIEDQVQDHISRGIAGQIVDWYGPGTTADMALPFVKSQAETTGGKYQFAVMLDKGYFQSCGNTVLCLNSGISYIVTHYASSSAYLHDSAGHPLIFFFINDYYPTQYALLGDPSVDPQGTSFVMYEPNGFPGSSPPNTVGEYGWVNPADGSSSTETKGSQGTFSWESDFGMEGLSNFLETAAANQSSYIVSEAFKGFDDNLANWSGNRVIDQQCGLTWLESFNHTGSFGGSSSYLANLNYLALGKRLDLIMVDTWDDYEEGTEIETGIDNCLSSLSVELAGNTLSWTPTWGSDPMNAAVSGSEATIFEYSVYLARTGGTDLMWLVDVPCENGACPHSIDLAGRGITGGLYVFYVQAVGQPSIVNTLGGPTSGELL